MTSGNAIIAAAPSGFDIVRASLEGSVAAIFPKARGAAYDAAVNFAAQAEKYETVTVGNTLFHCAVFGRDRSQAALALALVRNMRRVKDLQVLAGGKLLQEHARVESVLACYLEASANADPRAHCVEMIHQSRLVERVLSSPDTASPFADLGSWEASAAPRQTDPVIAFPCRYLRSKGFKFQPGHPSSQPDQLKAAAVREGCDWCPHFRTE